ncbi:MAG: VOC family protein [Clostridiales Family XIII bacterium]|jgi:methylmalonyl-CoA/ethylmalonyl-CoA epimerase|nr:VOC family protein [Clostridiales Family XIII bacterium]
MKQTAVFDEITQVSIIVDDIFASIRKYNDLYGIGPWIVLHFTPENTGSMVVRGKTEEFEMYLGLCESLNIQLELIQPVSRNTTYFEYLDAHGPGIHHFCLSSKEGYASVLEKLKERGHAERLLGALDSGGMEFTYVDLTDDLGFIAELVNPPADFISPPPVWQYPEDETER